jgi:hypothetical protein
VQVSPTQNPGQIPARVTHLSFSGALTNVHLRAGDTEIVADILSSQAGWLTNGAEVYVNMIPPKRAESQ